MSLLKSGLIPTGKPLSSYQALAGGGANHGKGDVDESEINLHLLPTNQNPQENFGAHCAVRSERDGKCWIALRVCLVSFSYGHTHRIWSRSSAESASHVHWTSKLSSASRDPAQSGK